MNKKYIVRLTPEQRAILEQRTRIGRIAVSVQRHARILLKADAADAGPVWDDAAIAAALDGALHRKPTTRRSQRKLDGVGETS